MWAVLIPARRLHKRRELVLRIGSLLHVARDRGLLRLQEGLELLLQLGALFPQRGVLRFGSVLGQREGAELGAEGVDLGSVLLRDVPRDLGLIHHRHLRHGGAADLDDGPEAYLTDPQIVREEGDDLGRRWLAPALPAPALMVPVGPEGKAGHHLI